METSFGICHLSSAALREEAGDRFEQTSTVLFGEHFQILERTEKWLRIKTVHDQYEGWLDAQQQLPLIESEHQLLTAGSYHISTEPALLVPLAQASTDFFPVPFGLHPGSILPVDSLGNYVLAGNRFELQGPAGPPQNRAFDKLPVLSAAFLHAPYHWGGRSPAGVDCSGLVQVLYRLLGIELSRDASQQALEGTAISFLEETLPGDLVFFDNAEGRIVHTGILLQQDQVLHASGWVRVDRIDHQGIYNVRMSRYSHKLRTIRRVLPG